MNSSGHKCMRNSRRTYMTFTPGSSRLSSCDTTRSAITTFPLTWSGYGWSWQKDVYVRSGRAQSSICSKSTSSSSDSMTTTLVLCLCHCSRTVSTRIPHTSYVEYSAIWWCSTMRYIDIHSERWPALWESVRPHQKIPVQVIGRGWGLRRCAWRG